MLETDSETSNVFIFKDKSGKPPSSRTQSSKDMSVKEALLEVLRLIEEGADYDMAYIALRTKPTKTGEHSCPYYCAGIRDHFEASGFLHSHIREHT